MTDAMDTTRELALLAGEAFARLRLEPEGYHRIEVDFVAFAGFDYV